MSLDISAVRSLGPLPDVGPLAFGHWRFVGHDLPTATRLVETALELGMNLIDTADVYGWDRRGGDFGHSESLLGAVLDASPSLRDEIVLATKGGITPDVPYDSSRRYLTTAVDSSLRRLGVERIDLYQIHRPDMFTHPEELAGTLRRFVDQGKVGAIGVSNFTPHQTETLVSYLGDVVVSTQPQFSADHLQPLRDGSLDQAMRLGLRPLAWSALGGGALATGHNVRTELMLEIDAIATREATDRTAVALAFVLAHPSRPVALVGSQRTDRLRAATAALDVELDRQDVYRLIQASEGEPLP